MTTIEQQNVQKGQVIRTKNIPLNIPILIVQNISKTHRLVYQAHSIALQNENNMT